MLPCVEITEMKTEIPKELQEFALDFANKKDILNTDSKYYSDNKKFFLEYIKENKKQVTDGRIKLSDGMFEIDKAKTLIKSSDYVYFLILVLYLTRYLDRNTDDKYAENLLRCDAIAIRNCKEKGLNIKSIVGDSLAMFRITESDLNKRRNEQLMRYYKDNDSDCLNAR